MFDDHQQPPQGGTPPSNLPIGEPDDMFATVDPNASMPIPNTPTEDVQSLPVEETPPLSSGPASALDAGILKPVQPQEDMGNDDVSQAPIVPPIDPDHLTNEDETPSVSSWENTDTSMNRPEAMSPVSTPVSFPEQTQSMPQPSAAQPESAMTAAPMTAVPPQQSYTPPVMMTPPEGAMEQQDYDVKGPALSKGLMVAIIIGIVVVILGGGGWWVYNAFVQDDAPDDTVPAVIGDTVNEQVPVDDEETVTPPVVQPDDSENVAIPDDQGPSEQDVDDRVLFGEPIDSDGDSLDDEREEGLGTDPENWDSDGDELSDGDEVIIWKTDPLNPDTDGDGFLDGKEIKNGYSPSGPGKIFEPPSGEQEQAAEVSTSTEESNSATST